MEEENSTRKNIINLLKKSSGMSIEELCREIDITPMGVRQHLLALEKKGVVTYQPKRKGIGRPGFIYMLTEAANDYFPSSYDIFALEVLRAIKAHEGSEKIEKIFAWRSERLLKTLREALSEKTDIEERLGALRDILNTNGNIVELSRVNGHYHLRQYHCPIKRISVEFHKVCAYELKMYKELLGENVSREHTVSEGAHYCLYIIPRA